MPYAAKSLQSCLTLCDPIDGSPPGSPIPGILQARTLEWVAISFSNAWKWKVKGKSLNRIRLLATPWTAAYQAPPSMGFSRQEYWSGVPLPSPICYGGRPKIDKCKRKGLNFTESLLFMVIQINFFLIHGPAVTGTMFTSIPLARTNHMATPGNKGACQRHPNPNLTLLKRA